MLVSPTQSNTQWSPTMEVERAEGTLFTRKLPQLSYLVSVILFFFYVVGICFFGVVTVFLVVGFQFQAFHKGKCVGTVVCKMGDHRNSTFRGYIAMLVVIKPYRGRSIGNGFFFFFLEVNTY